MQLYSQSQMHREVSIESYLYENGEGVEKDDKQSEDEGSFD